jgi:hypothetical protein
MQAWHVDSSGVEYITRASCVAPCSNSSRPNLQQRSKYSPHMAASSYIGRDFRRSSLLALFQKEFQFERTILSHHSTLDLPLLLLLQFSYP